MARRLPSPHSTATLINGIPLAAANIPAGKAILHELSSVLLPPDVADLLQAANNDTVDPFAGDTIVAADSDAATQAAGTSAPAPAAATSAAPVAGSAAEDAAAKARASAAAPTGRSGSTLMAAAVALPLLLAAL